MIRDTTALTLAELGWSPSFDAQLADDERELPRGRVFAVQRSGVTVLVAGSGEGTTAVQVPLGGRWFQLEAEARPTIGDWLLLDASLTAIVRLLERKSVLKRVAVAREREVQLIAANVDTMFLVSACNDEFNPSRMERYLVLALDAGVTPVVVLTKADLAADTDTFVAGVRALKRDLAVEVVDARDPGTLSGVRAWCQAGQTVALLGSSGVGKSTLVNSLSGSPVQITREARDDDAKGRHTTTDRSLHVLPDGGLLVDNPGMRELSLADVDLAGAGLFDDVDALARQCRFRDCRHEAEPGCAVRAAIEAGTLDARRLDSYRKLLREEARHVETVAQSRARFRALGKRYRQAKDESDNSRR
ncbi:MAG: ribosome small subunit-dependent GTPase A [Pseudomonadales bacterium]